MNGTVGSGHVTVSFDANFESNCSPDGRPVFLKPELLFHSPLRFILQVQRTDSQA